MTQLGFLGVVGQNLELPGVAVQASCVTLKGLV